MKQFDKVVLSAKDIIKNYQELEVLKGINLDIHQGEVVVIIGGIIIYKYICFLFKANAVALSI